MRGLVTKDHVRTGRPPASRAAQEQRVKQSELIKQITVGHSLNFGLACLHISYETYSRWMGDPTFAKRMGAARLKAALPAVKATMSGPALKKNLIAATRILDAKERGTWKAPERESEPDTRPLLRANVVNILVQTVPSRAASSEELKQLAAGGTK